MSDINIYIKAPPFCKFTLRYWLTKWAKQWEINKELCEQRDREVISSKIETHEETLKEFEKRVESKGPKIFVSSVNAHADNWWRDTWNSRFDQKWEGITRYHQGIPRHPYQVGNIEYEAALAVYDIKHPLEIWQEFRGVDLHADPDARVKIWLDLGSPISRMTCDDTLVTDVGIALMFHIDEKAYKQNKASIQLFGSFVHVTGWAKFWDELIERYTGDPVDRSVIMPETKMTFLGLSHPLITYVTHHKLTGLGTREYNYALWILAGRPDGNCSEGVKQLVKVVTKWFESTKRITPLGTRRPGPLSVNFHTLSRVNFNKRLGLDTMSEVTFTCGPNDNWYVEVNGEKVSIALGGIPKNEELLSLPFYVFDPVTQKASVQVKAKEGNLIITIDRDYQIFEVNHVSDGTSVTQFTVEGRHSLLELIKVCVSLDDLYYGANKNQTR